ncbi:MAG: hypothetical protein WAN43_01725 [Rhodomicrobium sp.]
MDRRGGSRGLAMTPRYALLLIAGMAAIANGCLANAAFAQNSQRVVNGPKNFLGQKYPGKLTGLSDEGISVKLREGGSQVVQFGEIWRIRKAFASDEPSGTSVIDFANNRLFVATPLDELIASLGKKVAITKLTAPNGEIIYMVASKVTDISRSLPGLHNPASKAVVGTRDGTQQVIEAVDDAKKLIADARLTP